MSKLAWMVERGQSPRQAVPCDQQRLKRGRQASIMQALIYRCRGSGGQASFARPDPARLRLGAVWTTRGQWTARVETKARGGEARGG